MSVQGLELSSGRVRRWRVEQELRFNYGPGYVESLREELQLLGRSIVS